MHELIKTLAKANQELGYNEAAKAYDDLVDVYIADEDEDTFHEGRMSRNLLEFLSNFDNVMIFEDSQKALDKLDSIKYARREAGRTLYNEQGREE